EANNLGLPLPKGRLTLEEPDADGDTAMIGRLELDHTAVNEEFSLRYGNAFDVVGERREVSTKANDSRGRTVVFEDRVRNHKTHAVRVRVVARHGLNGKVTVSSVPWTRHDYQTVYFDFVVKPNEERKITYTVDNPYEAVLP